VLEEVGFTIDVANETRRSTAEDEALTGRLAKGVVLSLLRSLMSACVLLPDINGPFGLFCG
jgi:hypothetical protein